MNTGTERNDGMSIDTKQLHGKFALVTGASSRIGRGIALRPAERGAAVAVLNGGSR
jgi:NAD(P)-dependent dehydrogenase (short-subunit alcohol dehydrogenase family)